MPRRSYRTSFSNVGKIRFLAVLIILLILVLAAGTVYFMGYVHVFGVEYDRVKADPATTTPAVPAIPPLDTAAYDLKMVELAHYGTSTPALLAGYTAAMNAFNFPSSATLMATSTASSTATTTPVYTHLWPPVTVYPTGGAILPFSRIVAYYGNFYSTGMGVLGEYPAPVMLSMLEATVAQWQAADPNTPVIPAIDYIAVTAQASPGPDGKYRIRMPASQINEAISLAAQVNGIVILDVQVGLSDLQTELPYLAPYLKLPQVELAVDPEFSMKDGAPPGSEIGTFDASDINYAANFLAQIVKQNNLPPKILVIHRFTDPMVTNVQNIKPLPQVEMVMDMDGWGSPTKKIGTYNAVVYPQPIQFTGFKLFYKNDLLPPSTGMMTPEQILQLVPAPLFIQYQ